MKLAEDQVTRSWEAAPAWFGRLPSEICEVRAVEAFREADMPVAFYNAPTEDGSRAGRLLHQHVRPARAETST